MLRRPRPELGASPARRAVQGELVTPVEPAATLVAANTFRFLEIERAVSCAADWACVDAEALWLFNLHYFDDLNARDAQSRTEWHLRLLSRWVAENPPASGIGWHPYPLCRRVVNWIKWSLTGNPLPEACVASLAVQARWLMRRLEYHIGGNHLLANAKALLFAGLYFEGDEAERWCSHGIATLTAAIAEQVLSDGGHFELSPMYHAAVLEDLLDSVNVLQAYGRAPSPVWLDAIDRMCDWLSQMTHPDGELAFFNDAAFGIAPTLAELRAYATRLHLSSVGVPPRPLAVLEPSGYVRALVGPAWLACDCGAIGPDYLPAHAHADTLSFEMSLGGQRIFVNSGTSVYGSGAERDRQRGTAAANTVVVDGQNSSEVWAGFRVARRARACLGSASLTGDMALIEARHNGYRRLPGRNEHRRRWTLTPKSLCIEDHVSGSLTTATAFWHLHPAIAVKADRPESLQLIAPNGVTLNLRFEGAAHIAVGTGTWHPRFGVSEPNQCITAQFPGGALKLHASWVGG